MRRPELGLGRIQRLDAWLCVWMNQAVRFSAVLALFRGVSWLGNGLFWYALMLGLLLRHRGDAALAVLHMAFVGVVCTATYQMVKRGTLRPRPFQTLREVVAGAMPLDRFSFPSGHTLHAVAFTTTAVHYYPDLAWPLGLFTVVTALSRVILGLHYPSDVLAGAALGGLIAGMSFRI